MSLTEAIVRLARRIGWDAIVSDGGQNWDLSGLYYESGDDDRDWAVGDLGIYMVRGDFRDSFPTYQIVK